MAYWSMVECLALALAAAAVVAPFEGETLQQDVLDAHNAARSAVGVGKVDWDNKVAAFAQSYARQRQGDCKLKHSDKSDRPNYGENISRSTNKNFSVSDAVGRWVKEKQYYHHENNSCSAPAGKSCGHYTQVVWRDSTAIGCARVVCDNNRGVFVTCNYNPPGNYRGQSPY